MNLKRLIIGDIHGHWENFRDIYYNEDPDEVIILGDYFDNFNGDDESIISCFDNICELRDIHNKTKKGKFIMLIGNHDFHYIIDSEQYSGYRNSYAAAVRCKINDNIDNMKFIHSDYVNKVIYSHAGITNSWMNRNKMEGIEDLELINTASYNAFKFVGANMYGNSIISSPIWIRPEALLMDCYEDENKWQWTQIVGHTNSSSPTIYKQDGYRCDSVKEAKEYKGSYHPEVSEWNIIYVMDCMPFYYMIETYNNKTKKITKRDIKYNSLIIKNYE